MIADRLSGEQLQVGQFVITERKHEEKDGGLATA
jgi:hypothetical protein